MIWLDVLITNPDKTKVKCGEIITGDPDEKGFIQGAFRYTQQYLDSPLVFPLDPVSLPLNSKEFSVSRAGGVHGVFEDALPDDWGRKLMTRQAGLPRKDQILPKLLGLLGSNGLGALSFEENGKKAKGKTFAGILDLPDLLEAACLFDAGMPVNEKQLKKLFVHGSSPGGARPKASIQKENGTLWLAKFPRQSDNLLVEAIEAGCLEMAQQSGLSVPEFELKDIGSRKVLLVKRFDVSDKKGRFHMISMQTLLRADGYYYLGYSDLFDILKKYSFQPSIDILALFQQMIFNAAIGNTDDHLKNFCMLHKKAGYCLSPV
jgi:serine/threonine-protein kinase HipA